MSKSRTLANIGQTKCRHRNLSSDSISQRSFGRIAGLSASGTTSRVLGGRSASDIQHRLTSLISKSFMGNGVAPPPHSNWSLALSHGALSVAPCLAESLFTASALVSLFSRSVYLNWSNIDDSLRSITRMQVVEAA